MRVLVTGAAGFIGSHVTDALAAAGHDVVALDFLLPQAHGAAGPPAWAEDHGLVVGDVRDADLLARLLRGVDVVCHQAAMVGHGVAPSDAPDYAAHNDLGTAVLLAAMHAAGVSRLVLASSMVVYGEGRYACFDHGVVRPGPRRAVDIAAGHFEPPCPHCGAALESHLVPEDAPLDPRSTYAASKLAQEHYAAAWARQTGGSGWALRYHNVYGPRMPRDTPYAGVASLFRSALERGQAPRVFEDGRQRRDFVHVTDVAAANVLAVAATAPSHTLEAVNVCSGVSHTVGELADELARACGGPRPRVVGGAQPGDVRHVVADPAKAGRLLGFTARVGFAEGVTAFATDPLRAPASVGVTGAAGGG
ncbi:NAD-dependent epimerase/dehydratase family protein [Goodfellowiella coeruleoviolacea]|uniref:dTDP-L-rhamnose 4-epimerase n=1 Tax=Goodfellowiella coeruleoviolacea TaxID=334858 RepID=A0AAE3GH76_9PSEU|nr:NAD-dependent epimerase/dehydratase family protein [Goodfellowiella coeruleoviolacea]MCP2167219.1 dTDP-L-rhamnose 4-epimerase [Goodfellowiella coeruleoviolacea]